MNSQTQTNVYKAITFIGGVVVLVMLVVLASRLGLAPLKADSEGVGIFIAMLLWIAVSLFVYFLPSVIAVIRNHHQVASIILINLFLGWTFIGWVVALAMSASAKRQ